MRRSWRVLLLTCMVLYESTPPIDTPRPAALLADAARPELALLLLLRLRCATPVVPLPPRCLCPFLPGACSPPHTGREGQACLSLPYT